jgi:APA family basic amino acid/polyamine antiporter
MPMVFVLVATWLIINTLVNKPVESMVGLALICLGLPLYLYYRFAQRQITKAGEVVETITK